MYEMSHSADRPRHLMLFRRYVSRNAVGKGRALLEGVGLSDYEIEACYIIHHWNEEDAVQAGLIKWSDGKGTQPPTWSVLIAAMEYAGIGQQHIHDLKVELVQSGTSLNLLNLLCISYP